ncbi:hypothetical protein YC2023_089516 [Brassica napus]
MKGDWICDLSLIQLKEQTQHAKQPLSLWKHFVHASLTIHLTSHKSPANAPIFNRSTSHTNLLKPLETATARIHKLPQPQPQPLRLNQSGPYPWSFKNKTHLNMINVLDFAKNVLARNFIKKKEEKEIKRGQKKRLVVTGSGKSCTRLLSSSGGKP